MTNKEKRAALLDFEATLKRVLEHIDYDEARTIFTGLKAERQDGFRTRAVTIGEEVDRLTKDFEAVFDFVETSDETSA